MSLVYPGTYPRMKIADASQSESPTRSKAIRLVIGSLILVLSTLLLVFVLLYALAQRPQAAAPQKANVCTSRACISASAMLQSHIDLAADPCQDFYRFACGGFQKSHPFTAKTVKSMLMARKENSIDGNLFEMLYFTNLSKPQHANEAELFQTLRYFYGTCMQWHHSSELKSRRESFLPEGWKVAKEDFDIKALVKPLIEYLEDFTGIEDFVARLVLSGTSELLLMAPVQRGLSLRPTVLHSISLVNWKNNFSEIESSIEKFCDLVSLNLTATLDEMQIAIGKINNASRSWKVLGPAPLQQLQLDIDNVTQDLKFNWTKFILVLNQSFYISLATEFSVGKYHLLLFVLEQLEPELRIRQGPFYDFIRLEAAMSAVNFLPDDPFLKLKSLFGKRKFLISKAEGRHSSGVCMTMALASMPPVAFEMYKSAYVSDSFDSVKKMIGNIQQAVRDSVDSEQWIRQPSKLSIKRKLNAIRSTVSYPRFNMSEFTDAYSKLTARVNQCKTFGDIVLAFKEANFKNVLWHLNTKEPKWKAREIFTNAMSVNAHYWIDANAMLIYLGLLCTRIYMKGYPDYLLYGGLGSVIGHEMGHAFDKYGIKYDRDGKKLTENPTIFDKVTQQRYNKRTQCLADSYSDLIGSDFDSFGTPVGIMKFGENFADIVGINAAFRAFRASMARSARPPQMLPGQLLSSLTPDQLFFVQDAQFCCTKAEREVLIRHYRRGNHSPPKPRVNGKMMHSRDFARVFSCKPGDRMYLSEEEKCRFW